MWCVVVVVLSHPPVVGGCGVGLTVAGLVVSGHGRLAGGGRVQGQPDPVACPSMRTTHVSCANPHQ